MGLFKKIKNMFQTDSLQNDVFLEETLNEEKEEIKKEKKEEKEQKNISKKKEKTKDTVKIYEKGLVNIVK